METKLVLAAMCAWELWSSSRQGWVWRETEQMNAASSLEFEDFWGKEVYTMGVQSEEKERETTCPQRITVPPRESLHSLWQSVIRSLSRRVTEAAKTSEYISTVM